jgi:hypothetical protein
MWSTPGGHRDAQGRADVEFELDLLALQARHLLQHHPLQQRQHGHRGGRQDAVVRPCRRRVGRDGGLKRGGARLARQGQQGVDRQLHVPQDLTHLLDLRPRVGRQVGALQEARAGHAQHGQRGAPGICWTLPDSRPMKARAAPSR